MHVQRRPFKFIDNCLDRRCFGQMRPGLPTATLPRPEQKPPVAPVIKFHQWPERFSTRGLVRPPNFPDQQAVTFLLTAQLRIRSGRCTALLTKRLQQFACTLKFQGADRHHASPEWHLLKPKTSVIASTSPRCAATNRGRTTPSLRAQSGNLPHCGTRPQRLPRRYATRNGGVRDFSLLWFIPAGFFTCRLIFLFVSRFGTCGLLCRVICV